MQPTRQITVFFSFLALLTLTGGLLLALEPEPLTPVQTAPTLLVASEPANGPASSGDVLREPTRQTIQPAAVITSTH